MGNVAADVCNPTIDRFKVSVENMYAPVDIGDENTNWRRGNDTSRAACTPLKHKFNKIWKRDVP